MSQALWLTSSMRILTFGFLFSVQSVRGKRPSWEGETRVRHAAAGRTEKEQTKEGHRSLEVIARETSMAAYRKRGRRHRGRTRIRIGVGAHVVDVFSQPSYILCILNAYFDCFWYQIVTGVSTTVNGNCYLNNVITVFIAFNACYVTRTESPLNRSLNKI